MAFPIAAIAAILGALGSMTQQPMQGGGGGGAPVAPGSRALGPSSIPLQQGSFMGGGLGGQNPQQAMMLQALLGQGARGY